MNIYRVLLVLLSAFIIGHRIFRYLRKEKSQSFFKVLSTIIIWLPIGIISYNPEFAYYVSGKLGFGENLNTLIFLAFIIVFAILFKLLGLIENIEKNLTEVVRKEALSSIKTNNENTLRS